MALLFMDSFDHYVTADIIEKWTNHNTAGGGSSSIHATAGRRGSGSFRTQMAGFSAGSGHRIEKVLAPSGTTCVMGFGFFMPTGLINAGVGIGISSLLDGLTQQVTLRVRPDGTLAVSRGASNGTQIGTPSTTPIAFGAYNYIEWKVTIHGSAGTVDIRLNNASILSLTGVNTQNTANTVWSGFSLGFTDGSHSGLSNPVAVMDFDDLYVLDGSGATPWNGFLGDVRVDPRYPTAAGATTGWTPSAGANWETVDDTAPNDDTDYNSTGTVGATDTFVVQDAPVSGGVLYGVQVNLAMKKSDAGICTVSAVVRHSGVDNLGPALNPSTAYTYNPTIFATNPGTALQWTEAGFNAAEFGYRRVS